MHHLLDLPASIMSLVLAKFWQSCTSVLPVQYCILFIPAAPFIFIPHFFQATPHLAWFRILSHSSSHCTASHTVSLLFASLPILVLVLYCFFCNCLLDIMYRYLTECIRLFFCILPHDHGSPLPSRRQLSCAVNGYMKDPGQERDFRRQPR